MVCAEESRSLQSGPAQKQLKLTARVLDRDKCWDSRLRTMTYHLRRFLRCLLSCLGWFQTHEPHSPALALQEAGTLGESKPRLYSMLRLWGLRRQLTLPAPLSALLHKGDA